MISRAHALVVTGAGAIAGLTIAIELGVAPVDARPHDQHAPHRHDGLLWVDVLDERGLPLPARLTFRGVGETPTPEFTKVDIAREERGAVSAFDRAFVLRGEAELRVPPGTYDVFVGHGPEYEALKERVTITAGEDAELNVTLRHVVDSRGWISADFHVHAAPSFDSRVPLRDRVHQFVGDGVDFIVSTDHNMVTDYAPVIGELGVADLLGSAQGDEITTKDWGHYGAFPLPAEDSEVGRGAVPAGKRAPKDIFADVRRSAPAALIDIHHPRLESGPIGYFNDGAFDPKTLRAKRPGFSFDFDAIEVLNGYQDPDRKSVDRVLADWYALLGHGVHVTGTGNRDSHHMTFNLGGYPRNYVQVPDDEPGKLDGATVAAAVKAGRAFFTTGPFLRVTSSGYGLGDVAPARKGKLPLSIEVQAPAWMDVSKLTVILDGQPVLTQDLADTGDVIRFQKTLTIPVDRDGWVIVRVDGAKPMAPWVGDDRFKVYPIAVTNPIWIDADGDGRCLSSHVGPTRPPTH